MATVTWLHLSDWHQHGEEFGRQVVRDALLRDIEAGIADDGLQPDFIVFSGDTAFGGRDREYEAAQQHLFDPVVSSTGVPPDRWFFVPGNHDLDRDVIATLPVELQQPFTDERQADSWLTDPAKRAQLLRPFEAYRHFVSTFTGQDQPDFTTIRRLNVGGTEIALLGVNSALMCGRHKDADGKVNDYGYLHTGEPQLYDALGQIASASLRIGVMHHPFAWMSEFDRTRIEGSLGEGCHFLLRGHLHMPQVIVNKGSLGDCVILPAGAAFNERVAWDARYTNAYNFTRLNLDTGIGTVYLRRWSDGRGEWLADVDVPTADPDGRITFALPKHLGAHHIAPTASPLTSLPSEATLYSSCFLSYSPDDAAFAERLYQDLTAAGVLVWKDDLARGGRYYRAQVALAISEQHRLLLVCSHSSLVNENVVEQVVTATDREREAHIRKLFPLKLDDFILSDNILRLRDEKLRAMAWSEDWVREVRAYFILDFSKWKDEAAYQKAFAKLLRDLQQPPTR